MSQSKTIHEAILKVLQDELRPLSAKWIYQAIENRDYYRFRSENPEHIVLTTLRRRSIGIELARSSKRKSFQVLSDGSYWFKDKPIPVESKARATKVTIKEQRFEELSKSHGQYIKEFKLLLLEQLKQVEPTQFEHFAKNLLRVYGFKDVHVTRATKDGGIDGYGKFKLGITFLDVAFECKRWTKTTVPSKEVASFRGNIQGEYAQGIYFTTSKFSKEAKEVALKKGGAPIALIDGEMLVEIMMDKRFGVDVEDLPLYSINLDDVLD